ncbi:MAG TPA: response regulator transcription factor [Solirubrobacteraceae bacterium]|nr:response regulator transcription factor [Solirubrobacteraceae bacterium]
MSAIRVLVADDQALARDGLRTILEAREGIEVVGEATDGEEAIEQCLKLQPNVVLMDIRMPRLDGLQATRRLLQRPDVRARIVMLTTFDQDEYVYEAMRSGASGFLLKDAPREQLVAGVRAAAAGDTLLAPTITRRLVEQYIQRPSAATPTSTLLAELTPRELEILRLVARGLSNAEIATAAFLAEATVKTHISRILTKLDLRDRTQAVITAYETGLVQPGDTTAT